MPITVVGGLQRGDEGKGRFADELALMHDIVARYNGGPNAGHTVVTPDEKVLKLHLVPSGITHPHAINVIGGGTVIDPIKLVAEIDSIEQQGFSVTPDNLKISSDAHLIMPEHISRDEVREAGVGGQGSTKSGIAQVYADKALREGARAEMFRNDLNSLVNLVAGGIKRQNELRGQVGLELLAESLVEEYRDAAWYLGQFVTDTVLYVNDSLSDGKSVLAEGAQAFQLDIDHGMYPYVSSSSPGVGGVLTGLGVPAQAIERVIGVAKVIPSHVGGGPFVTEITDKATLTKLHGDMSAVDAEKGTTTGRIRRLGHLDLPTIRRAVMVNGVTEVYLTKLDWVPRFGEMVRICVDYERKGKILPIPPSAAYKLKQSSPIYSELPNWVEDIQDVREFEDLPYPAQDYVDFIAQALGRRVSKVGVGPGRDQVIEVPAN